MIYEVTNPSDALTIQAEDFRIACLAALYLGNGAYGLVSDDDSQTMPPMVLISVEDWWREQFDEDWKGIVLTMGEKLEIIKVLRSAIYGNIRERKRFEKIVTTYIDPEEKRATFIHEWNDDRRSSINNIRARALKLAESFEKNYATR